MNLAIQLLLGVHPDGMDMKPMLVPCACGNCQIHYLFNDDSILYGTALFESQHAAAVALADVIVDAGIKTRKTD